jgi:dTDP-4-dehydrorhamnose reductase
VLILGASGMLGNAALRVMADSEHEVFGSIRSEGSKRLFSEKLAAHLVVAGDVEKEDALISLFQSVRPQVVINCIGLVKQLSQVNDPLVALPINALLPHRLARLCDLMNARLVHVSTDCVFSGSKGGYTEDDAPDAGDLYGRSKLLGEVDYPNAITMRTSIIGHELAGAHGLIGWFLQQKDKCYGYNKAIFSGFPTVELARIIRDVIMPRPDLSGLYHVASAPINKYDLLQLVAEVYGKQVEIVPDSKLVIDRSLNADRFRTATGYTPPSWPELVKLMHAN